MDALGRTASRTPWTPLRTSLPAALGEGLRPDGSPPHFSGGGVGPFPQELPNPLNELTTYTETVKGAVRLALLRAYKTAGANSIEVVITPKRGVFATSAVPAGGITLIPVTPTVGVLAPDAPYPSTGIPLGTLALPGSSLIRKFYLNPVFNAPPAQGAKTRDALKEIVVPAWCVRVHEDGMQANMKIGKIDVAVEGVKVPVPMFTTSADVGEGDELLLYTVDRKRGLSEAGPLARTLASCSHRVPHISAYRGRFRGSRDVSATVAIHAPVQ